MDGACFRLLVAQSHVFCAVPHHQMRLKKFQLDWLCKGCLDLHKQQHFFIRPKDSRAL